MPFNRETVPLILGISIVALLLILGTIFIIHEHKRALQTEHEEHIKELKSFRRALLYQNQDRLGQLSRDFELPHLLQGIPEMDNFYNDLTDLKSIRNNINRKNSSNFSDERTIKQIRRNKEETRNFRVYVQHQFQTGRLPVQRNNESDRSAISQLREAVNELRVKNYFWYQAVSFRSSERIVVCSESRLRSDSIVDGYFAYHGLEDIMFTDGTVRSLPLWIHVDYQDRTDEIPKLQNNINERKAEIEILQKRYDAKYEEMTSTYLPIVSRILENIES